jgi:DNA-binding transcriptional ArsR family regulator
MSLNDAFKALADPTRRKILDLLKQRSMNAGDIAAHFDMTKPSISNHLNVLKQANLVRDERRGQHIVYSLNTTVFQDVLKWILDLQHAGGKDD